MPFPSWNPDSPIALERFEGGWRARLMSQRDLAARAFEEELLRSGVELSLYQQLRWLDATAETHWLFQLRAPDGHAAMQAVITLDRPRRLAFLARGRVHQLGAARDAAAERNGLALLLQLCRASGALVSLRLQPHREEPAALAAFGGLARGAGFSLVEPVGVTRTLLLDLSQGTEAILSRLSKKTRWRVRHKSRERVELRVLTDLRYLPSCVAAANASLARTHGGTSRYDFAAAFRTAAREPDRVRITGVFLRERPDELLAFNIGVRHGARAEYASAGSFADPVLRALPFNYWLLWEVIEWAERGGATLFDLGGITDGSEADPCRGISAFKRHFCDREVEVGLELGHNLRPLPALALDLWSALRAMGR